MRAVSDRDHQYESRTRDCGCEYIIPIRRASPVPKHEHVVHGWGLHMPMLYTRQGLSGRVCAFTDSFGATEELWRVYFKG